MRTTPLPHPNIDSQPYWEGAARDELRYQRCAACHHAQFPPRAQCLRCGGKVEWQLSAGAGVVHSYTRVERAPSAAFKAQLPQVHEFLAKFGDDLPAELSDQLAAFEQRLDQAAA
jgi:uncharacterized OB-fold protein